jgi:hypothetical protein
MTDTSGAPIIRCSSFNREIGVDPIGSAGAYDTFVLVEQPLPWPRDVSEHSLLGGIGSIAEKWAPGRLRIQAILNPDTVDSERHLIVYRRNNGPFISYKRDEVVGGPSDLEDLAQDILRTPVSTETKSLDDRDVDLLICTHGTRDRCCGSFGTRLWRDARPGPNVRMWRTSHTGGHRFAPTALLLPSGQYWAYLDDRLLDLILNRSCPVSDVAPYYRGCAAFPSPAAQAAEREAFGRVGWEWLDWSRWSEAVTDARVRIHFESPTGRKGTYEAETALGPPHPVPICGQPIDASISSASDITITSFDQIA